MFDRREVVFSLGCGAAGAGMISLSSGTASAASSGSQLPRSTPAAQGVSAAAIRQFLAALSKADIEMHSLMMVRHGHVVVEGWWAPYRPDAVHLLYSVSKSFTSTAIGFAVAEGLLKVTDKVIDFFPDKLPAVVSENLAMLTVKDLLTMSVGRAVDSTGLVTKQKDWVKAFLAAPFEHKPGTVFHYDSAGTYMLSAILQKRSGHTVLSYLQPRLFQPLGVRGMTWETCPLGISTGGWGLSATTETLAKLGQLYLQKGIWNGKQLLPASWVEQATSFHIQQPVSWGMGVTQNGDPAAKNPSELAAELKRTSDWFQGYGYQFWRCRHNAYRADGAFGQFIVAMPDQDAVIAITSSTGNMQAILDNVWNILLPAMQDGMLPEDRRATSSLKTELKSLTLSYPKGAASSATAKGIAGKSFTLEPNDLGVKAVSFVFSGGSLVVRLKFETSAFEIHCGFERWMDGKMKVNGFPPEMPGLLGNSVKPEASAKVAGAYAWKDENSIEMQWRYYETPHRDVVTCRFDGDRVEISFLKLLIERSPLRGRVI